MIFLMRILKKFKLKKIFLYRAIHHMYIEINDVFENLYNHLNKSGKI